MNLRPSCYKSLFVCTTNQRVIQAVDQATNKFGIDAIAFWGKQAEYTLEDKAAFNTAHVIGVTSYSSFFATPSFFDDVEILIFDANPPHYLSNEV